MFKERPFGPKPETKNKEQRNYTDKLIESVRKEPHAYRPLRKDVDAGLMTRDQAFEVLKAWQKVIEEQEIAWKKNNKDELQQILSSEKLPDTETEQYTYPEQYRVKDITEQFDSLRDALHLQEEIKIPDHDLSNDSTINGLRRQFQLDHGNPEKIDGIFYIPPIYLVANVARQEYPEETKNKADDEVATWYVLKRLKEVREEQKLKSFNNYLKNELGPKSLRLHPRAALAHAKHELQATTQGLTFLPVQTGQARKGESPRYSLNTLKTVKGEDGRPFQEVPLDLYTSACLMLTHPERANHINESNRLFINVIGSEHADEAGDTFGNVPSWRWHADALSLDGRWADNVNQNCAGSSSFVAE